MKQRGIVPRRKVVVVRVDANGDVYSFAVWLDGLYERRPNPADNVYRVLREQDAKPDLVLEGEIKEAYRGGKFVGLEAA